MKSGLGGGNNDLEQLAAMGNYRRSSGHVAGQLTTKYCKDDSMTLPQPYFFECPVLKKSPDSWYLAKETVANFLPHEWFSWLESHDSVSGASHLADFWASHNMSDPKLAKNPIYKEAQVFLPMLLHGDGGAFQRNDSINIISMRSLLSASNVATSQLLLAAVPKACCNKSDDPELDTMTAVWEVLVWSFQHMFYGKHPEFDHQGKAWAVKSKRAQAAGTHLQAGKLRGCLFCISADGEYLQNEFKLAGASHNECCFNCKANKSDVPYNDFRPAAAWRKTIVQHKDKTPTSHPLKKIPGVNGHSFHYDTLHNLEEGVAAHAVGNAMFDLVCRTGGFPGTQEEALQTLYKKIAQQYVEQGIESSNRIKRLTFSSLCNAKSKFDNFPVLSGFKAKHIRWLVNCMAPILQEFVVEEDPYTKHRLLVMENLEGMYDCMDRCHLHMDKATAKQFKQFGDMALLHYAKCSKISISAGKLAWSATPKFHWVAHMVEQAAFLNPKYVSTYSGETMVGYQASLAHACLNGTAPHKVPEKVVWRFRLGLHLKFLYGCEEIVSDSVE